MSTIRTGIGFDLHALVPDVPLIIGGIEISHDHGPRAHSDGDVLLHAASDACLGAAGLGDIGELFPDDDPAYENLPGRDMVEQVRERIRTAGWAVQQMDSIILLETPRLGSLKNEIKHNIADLFDLDPSDAGVKATGMEGLGIIGNESAVAAWATVTLTEHAETKS